MLVKSQSSIPQLPFDVAPYRLSGTVFGVLLNQADALASLGEAASRPPYKAAPRAPVLYVKPRNTLAGSGSTVALPAGVPALSIGASIGLVIGRTACRVSEPSALGCVAGYTLVADLSIAHDTFYRPSVRLKALDNSCLVGPRVVARAEAADPSAFLLRVTIGNTLASTVSFNELLRPAARLLADVTDFMTLQPGDILMLGAPIDGPLVAADDRFAIDADGLGRLHGSVSPTEDVA